ncbi:MAG: site-specific integrase [Burkholderiaceae bacterium]|nr:site-specific integrase [Burkholderiaceae bacterium]
MGSIPASRTKNPQALEYQELSGFLGLLRHRTATRAARMQGVFLRGGVFQARLVVPPRLRAQVGRREFLQSTRTSDRRTARVVAAGLLARWHRLLFEIEGGQVLDSELLRLVDGSPELALGGYVAAHRAAELTGLPVGALMQAAAAGRFKLHCRVPSASAAGYVVLRDDLQLHDLEHGALSARVVPLPSQMAAIPSASAVNFAGQVLALDDSAGFAAEVVADKLESVSLVALSAPGRPAYVFAPDTPIEVAVADLVIDTGAFELWRATLAANVPAARVAAARAAQQKLDRVAMPNAGKWASKPFSEAVAEYCASANGLPKTLNSAQERRSRKVALLHFGAFMGDLPLGRIEGDTLRAFRDQHLPTFPARSNHIPTELRRERMPETIAALKAAHPDWPLMSPGMRAERMQWLYRLFDWCKERGYLALSPATGLIGETGITKEAAKRARRDKAAARAAEAGEEDEADRRPFNSDELTSIFSQTIFSEGEGRAAKGNSKNDPFEYWLPLLGLFSGLRIKEASQLYLSDIKKVGDSWFLDINENTEDKSLKNEQSNRLVPIHPFILKQGLIEYSERLQREGYKRLFPELSCASSDARYAKGSGRKMSLMLERLGMPRDGTLVYHCLRHNLNNELARVPSSALGFADDTLARLARYRIMGHQPDEDVNLRHYLKGKESEMVKLMNEVNYEGLPEIAAFDIDWGIASIAKALNRKGAARKGKEDLGEERARFNAARAD